jgi:hypothetical protein
MKKIYSNQNKSVNSTNSQAGFLIPANKKEKIRKTEEEIVKHCIVDDSESYDDTIEWHSIHLDATTKRESKDGAYYTIGVEGFKKFSINQLFFELKRNSTFKDREELEEWLKTYALTLLAEYCGIENFVSLELVGSEIVTTRIRPFGESD